MEFSKKMFGWWGGLAVKCALSCVVVWVLLALLNMMWLWYAIHPASRRDAAVPQLSGGANLKPEDLARDGGIYWPQFPGSSRSSVQQVSINGVQMTSQAWETTVPAKDVIAFYREQMTARGWEDVTEENFKLKPELRDPGISENSLQGEHYLKIYGDTIDSNLVLRRGNCSIQVMAAPNEEGKLAQTTVRISAATTPSINDFVTSLSPDSAAGSDAISSGKPLEMEQTSAGQRYHTSIAFKDEEPGRIFNEILKEYQDKNWHCLTFPSVQAGQPGYFASLVKGQSYGYLSVKASSGGKGSSVTFTEVTPD